MSLLATDVLRRKEERGHPHTRRRPHEDSRGWSDAATDQGHLEPRKLGEAGRVLPWSPLLDLRFLASSTGRGCSKPPSMQHSCGRNEKLVRGEGCSSPNPSMPWSEAARGCLWISTASQEASGPRRLQAANRGQRPPLPNLDPAMRRHRPGWAGEAWEPQTGQHCLRFLKHTGWRSLCLGRGRGGPGGSGGAGVQGEQVPDLPVLPAPGGTAVAPAAWRWKGHCSLTAPYARSPRASLTGNRVLAGLRVLRTGLEPSAQEAPLPLIKDLPPGGSSGKLGPRLSLPLSWEGSRVSAVRASHCTPDFQGSPCPCLPEPSGGAKRLVPWEGKFPSSEMDRSRNSRSAVLN